MAEPIKKRGNALVYQRELLKNSWSRRKIFVESRNSQIHNNINKYISKPKVFRETRRRVNKQTKNTMFLNGITHLGKKRQNNNQRGSIYEAFVFAHVVKKNLSHSRTEGSIFIYDIFLTIEFFLRFGERSFINTSLFINVNLSVFKCIIQYRCFSLAFIYFSINVSKKEESRFLIYYSFLGYVLEVRVRISFL